MTAHNKNHSLDRRLSQAITSLPVPERYGRKLEYLSWYGYPTIGCVIRKNREDLVKHIHIGDGFLDELEKVLREIGFKLGLEVPQGPIEKLAEQVLLSVQIPFRRACRLDFAIILAIEYSFHNRDIWYLHQLHSAKYRKRILGALRFSKLGPSIGDWWVTEVKRWLHKYRTPEARLKNLLANLGQFAQ